MDVTYAHCAGLDVHKKTVVACCLVTDATGTGTTHTCTFGTHTPELLALHDWLLQQGVSHVAMESTSEYVRRITARAIPPAGRLGSE